MNHATTAPVLFEPLAAWHAAGTDPEALARAVTDAPPVAQPELLGEAPQQPIPVLSDPALDGQGYAARMDRLVADSAPRLSERLTAAPPAAAVVIPPGPHQPGVRWAQHHWLIGQLTDRVSPLRRVAWWRPQGPVSAVQLLHRAAQAVAEGRLASLLIGGVDPCAAPAACADPRLRRRCLPAIDGPPAADGAAFLLLRTAPAGSAGLLLQRAALGGPSEQPATWQRLLQETVPEADAAGALVEAHGFGATPAERQAWANVRRLVPALRRTPAAARHLLWRGLGFSGAATLPLQLVAAAGLLHAAEGPQRILLTAAGDGVAGVFDLRKPAESTVGGGASSGGAA
ncbi:hypothetical protein [Halorhodospira halophila]|uniref:Uncharacterized protein n=1 Tax=Halorhodospira halophila (strain DSM 244 / SL1) TaxID=349124 RepID=A1WVJ3_HALHL|nr:hypothetical protein [Halorhodospira halophila]ABM61705.1 hypothetical protein Hhal_0929 [Halorhodospira halophila SL1]MBK1728965.1 hypothetical protein [Halorhodospira halophila]